MKFTTSWDDGYTLDKRTADILSTYGCQGTFYVCPKPQHGYDMLQEDEIRILAQQQEIGAHTLTHPDLTQISEALAQEEMQRSKDWIESITEKPCTMFCYPYGKYNERIAAIAQKIGFHGARTTEQFQFRHSNPFTLPVSLHMYPFPLRPVLNRRCTQPIQRAYSPLTQMHISITDMRGWLPMAKAVFKKVYVSNASWFHLFGHSYEPERYNMWNHLENFLKFVNGFEDIEHVPNSALL